MTAAQEMTAELNRVLLQINNLLTHPPKGFTRKQRKIWVTRFEGLTYASSVLHSYWWKTYVKEHRLRGVPE